jgi:hypothetical protein
MADGRDVICGVVRAADEQKLEGVPELASSMRSGGRRIRQVCPKPPDRRSKLTLPPSGARVSLQLLR